MASKGDFTLSAPGGKSGNASRKGNDMVENQTGKTYAAKGFGNVTPSFWLRIHIRSGEKREKKEAQKSHVDPPFRQSGGKAGDQILKWGKRKLRKFFGREVNERRREGRGPVENHPTSSCPSS